MKCESTKLKNIIFNKLYQDLKNVEIIPYQNSIWFIDREKKYWYFEYEKSGTLWWRYVFFEDFFHLFSLKENKYEPILSEWAEEVLNYKVKASLKSNGVMTMAAEEVCKVNASHYQRFKILPPVEDVLNQNN